jgi:hypothetical protein
MLKPHSIEFIPIPFSLLSLQVFVDIRSQRGTDSENRKRPSSKYMVQTRRNLSPTGASWSVSFGLVDGQRFTRVPGGQESTDQSLPLAQFLSSSQHQTLKYSTLIPFVLWSELVGHWVQ